MFKASFASDPLRLPMHTVFKENASVHTALRQADHHTFHFQMRAINYQNYSPSESKGVWVPSKDS